jgi:hypothetical protein
MHQAEMHKGRADENFVHQGIEQLSQAASEPGSDAAITYTTVSASRAKVMLLGKFIGKRTGTKIQPWQSQVEKCPPFKKP